MEGTEKMVKYGNKLYYQKARKNKKGGQLETPESSIFKPREVEFLSFDNLMSNDK